MYGRISSHNVGLEKPGPEVRGLSSVTSVKLYLHTSSPRYKWVLTARGFPGGSGGKESAYNAKDPGSKPRSGRSLEKEMAAHSSILVWRIPWTEEPGGLQAMGLQRVGLDFHFNSWRNVNCNVCWDF